MKKIFVLIILAMSLVFVSCTSADNKNASDKKESTANEENAKKEEKADKDEDKKDKTEKTEEDLKDKVNIKYFDEFKDDELIAIANVTHNNDKQDLFAAYNVKELLLSENDDAKEYLIFPKEDKTELAIKSKDSDTEGESFTLGKKFGLKLAISDSDLDKYTIVVKHGDKAYDINLKLKEDGRLDLPKEAVEVLFK